MPPAFPPGEPAPSDGSLPPQSMTSLVERDFGVYVHVPFCRVRCGYCDFNTYTALELGPHGASAGSFAEAAVAEMTLAAEVLSPSVGVPAVSTVFFGGGTPTLLPPADLARMLTAVDERWGLASGAEVTTEANPDTLTPEVALALATGGFSRVSIGMQSAVPHVLRTLDRTHDPANVATAVEAARSAGMQVSLDVIYGTPGESLDDWRATLDQVLALEPDHVSAYALTIEPGTAMGSAVRRGTLPMPTDDDEADKYELGSEVLEEAGFTWYEISNWSRTPETRCRHNIAYWRGENWWGVGPGAHSHVGGTRWWNVKHPAAYADRLHSGLSPAHSREVLTTEQQHDEQVLLGIRLAQGLSLDLLDATGRAAVAGLIAAELLDGASAIRGRAVLTRRGRLIADTVVHALLASGARGA
ncbi:MAG: radical SAM family heme chaperone HemW [Ornithinimicrobium sp.]